MKPGFGFLFRAKSTNPETSSFESFPRWAIPSTIVIFSMGEIENHSIYMGNSYHPREEPFNGHLSWTCSR